MKRYTKYLLITLLLLLLIPSRVLALNVVYTADNGSKIVIEDDADLLTKEEEEKLLDKMITLTEYGHVVFKTIKSSP